MNTNAGNHLEDKLLVDKALRGNMAAFGTIIQNTEKLVAHIVFKMIDNEEDRKDLAQDIYVKIYHKLAGFKFESKLSTWIARISYNTCLDYLRKKKPVLAGGLFGDNDTGDDLSGAGYEKQVSRLVEPTMPLVQQKEIAGILQVEIEKLSPVYKTLITLFHQEEMSYDEIGEITGLPAGTVKSYLFRARAALRKGLLRSYKKEDL